MISCPAGLLLALKVLIASVFKAVAIFFETFIGYSDHVRPEGWLDVPDLHKMGSLG